ncbi:sporulation initiation factor Spo0A C-terminal domain-containing protein [Lawsonibacter sp. OA9]|uniref:sporulation initiation factor Spo0A C-terminal domain-containing protein n=1 Tax=Oscillospiraceae TaxID=216572 RepID=UPI001F07005C|nr:MULTISPECIES: sporulation initiation factor Spo0A C-terminal domain-containing protein [Oscillospiraceae]MCH1978244.1 sporulation initiation factor Spo0A C-terminal domain-containing protein [Lawsonibacter sp. OA9]MCH1982497.1 sporulation initiation factor Spo0A C-terminal domain-containing protein [Ruminococcus sp. OA3]
MTLRDVITLIQSISGHPCHRSYYCLALAVYYSCQLPFYMGLNLERQVYPLISQETGLPVKSIARSISRASSDCWEYGDHTKLEQIVKRKLIEPPSPKELILYLCTYLTDLPAF